MDEFRWCFGTVDVLSTLGRLGPVVLGINWYEGMWEPDVEGLIHVQGSVVGGHAILATAYSKKRDAVRLHNSWGRSWGRDGDVWISVADLDQLLHEEGEACVPIHRN